MQTLNAAYVDQTALADPFSLEAVPAEPIVAWEPRSRLILLPYLFAVLISGASWLSGGVPVLTDIGFFIFTAFTAVFLLVELLKFPRRFGVGAVVLFAGSLIWFCYDYFENWFLRDFKSQIAPFQPDVVAKAAFYHLLLVSGMVAGLFIPWGRTLERFINGLPEPTTPSFYFILSVLLFCVGISPYFIWAVDAPHVAIFKSMIGGYAEQPGFTAGRTGSNFNFNWGGYIPFIIQLGKIGGILAVFYATLITQSRPVQLICWLMWAFWMAISFGTGVRGEILYMALPVGGLLYLKYQSLAAVFASRHRVLAYVLPAVLLGAVLLAVQFVAYSRNRAYTHANWSNIKLTELKGNHMFSESLAGFSRIGDELRPFRDTFPGANIIRPIPDVVFNFFVTPIPRALWRSKPIDEAEEWYNKLAFGHHYRGGGSVAHGAPGYWYFRYGAIGVIQGGLFLGWLLAVTERSIRNSGGRPMALLISLAIAVWLFRCFRGFNFVTLHPVLVGGVALWFILKFQTLFRPSQQ
jgi:hypothetical protein